MRKYETVFISDPDLSEQARTDLYDKVRNIIANEKGILLDFEEWGTKKLAYEIKKKLRGAYVCATYGGTGDLVKELERNFRLTDDVLKFMTIVLSEDTTAEELEKEMAAEPEAEEAAQEEEAAADAPADAEAADTPAEDAQETPAQEDAVSEEATESTES